MTKRERYVNRCHIPICEDAIKEFMLIFLADSDICCMAARNVHPIFTINHPQPSCKDHYLIAIYAWSTTIRKPSLFIEGGEYLEKFAG